MTFLLLAAGTATAQIQPGADRILRRMFETYRAAPAFACEGSFMDSNHDRRALRMIFSRPNRMRLAWTETDFYGKTTTNTIFNRHGKTLFHWETLGEEKREASLTDAIDECAGISLGLSLLIPSLLRGESGYLSFVSLRRLPDAKSEGGHACWRLAGKTQGGDQYELLIDRKDYALRQAAEIAVVEPVTAMQVRASMARTNPKIAREPLPPSRKVRSTYRFKNIRFTGSWPERAFDL